MTGSTEGQGWEAPRIMSRRVFCPYCKTMQPLGTYQEGDQPKAWCLRCGTVIEQEYRPGQATSRQPTVLCIDDDRLILGLCREALQRRGYRVLLAADGRTGIEEARRERPALILLDFMMPTMDGLEVCRRLRAEPALRETRIILLTASERPGLDVEARAAGATLTLRKPFGPDAIVATVDGVLGRTLGPGPP